MDAVHLMRAATGRDLIIKVEGCYHGHHDSVEVSVLPEERRGRSGRAPGRGRRQHRHPAVRSSTCRWSSASTTSTWSRGSWPSTPGRVAGMIVEPVMMNAGIILPEPGYLGPIRDLLHGARRAAGVRRGQDRPHRRSPGGVTAVYGVTPDIICLAKALGGGAAVGRDRRHRRGHGPIADGPYEQVGTFNGNPLAMAAARATLTEVLTPAAYAHIERAPRPDGRAA